MMIRLDCARVGRDDQVLFVADDPDVCDARPLAALVLLPYSAIESNLILLRQLALGIVSQKFMKLG